MAELNLKQITDKLNSEFASDVRKLVFWYDANAEFQEDIKSIELENAKVLHLEPDNQFYIKYFLEREDTTTNYLVYAPFAKPSIRDNHLADTIRYSKEFFADRASLLTLDLGIDERYKSVIQHYIKFFANKDRTQKFYDLEIENFNRSTIEVALMSVLCKDKTASFEEVLRSILTDDGLQDNKYLAEFEKYDLLSAFWQQADVAFGYNDPKPTLEKLVITMFVTYAAKSIHTDMPQAWKPFISYKFGNIIAFMDNLVNSYLYGTRFDELSEIIYNAINGKNYLEKMEIETLVDCNIFAGVDELLISWIIGRLENEDIGAKLNGKTIPELCVERRKQHFGKNFRSEYFILQNAFDMIAEGKYQPVSGIKNMVKEYTESTYKIDRYYRYFYFYFDKLEDTTQFEKIRELVENIYTNEYLNRITVNWNNELADADGETGLTLQRDFFARHINYSKDRVVVIISDALRYEVAHTLFEKMQADEEKAVVQLKKEGSRSVLVSDRGHIENKPNGDRYIVLDDGRKYDTKPSGLGASVSDFREYEIRMDSSPSEVGANKKLNAMPIEDLIKRTDNRAASELFWRISWPLVALNLALLAIPLSYNNPRSMKYYGQTAAVLIFILYLNALSIFQTWITQGKVGILGATLYMNVPVAVLTTFLFYRLMTINQGRFDAFIYWLQKPFRALAGKFKRKKETP